MMRPLTERPVEQEIFVIIRIRNCVLLTATESLKENMTFSGFQRWEYLTWVKDTGLVTNIELKNSVYYYEHLEEKVIDMVREFQMEDRVIFSSFNLVSINKCKKMLPEVPMGYLMEARMDNMGFFTEENGVEYYHPDKNFLTEEMVRDCHAHGIGVNVWTVNKKELMEQLNNWNVDGIFTNFPDRAKELGLEK